MPLSSNSSVCSVDSDVNSLKLRFAGNSAGIFIPFHRIKQEFYRYEEVTVPMGRFARVGNVKDVFRRMCTDPADDYKKLACAYYLIAYGKSKF